MAKARAVPLLVGEHDVSVRQQLKHRVEKRSHSLRRLIFAAELADDFPTGVQFHHKRTVTRCYNQIAAPTETTQSLLFLLRKRFTKFIGDIVSAPSAC